MTVAPQCSSVLDRETKEPSLNIVVLVVSTGFFGRKIGSRIISDVERR